MDLAPKSLGKQWLYGYLERDKWYTISLEMMGCCDVTADE